MRRPTKKKRLTEAQRIDAAIDAAALATAEARAAALEEEHRKEVLAALAKKYGVSDGNSWRLGGRRYHCTVTANQALTMAPDLVERLLPKEWRKQLFSRLVVYAPAELLKQGYRQRAWRAGLPKRVRTMLQRHLNVSNWFSVRFDGAPRPEIRAPERSRGVKK